MSNHKIIYQINGKVLDPETDMIESQVVQKTYEESIEKNKDIPYNYASMFRYFVECPFYLYCTGNVDEKYKDRSTAQYILDLFSQGDKVEETILENQYEALTCTELKGQNGFYLALILLERGEKEISGVPLIYYPKNMYGRADLLIKRKGKSIFGNYYYQVVEIKRSDYANKSAKLQAMMYNYMIGKIQKYTPETIIIKTSESEEEIIYDEEYFFQQWADMIDILKGEKKPEAIYGKVLYDWKNYNNAEAIKNKDISILKWIAETTRTKLIEKGIRTIKQIANAKPKDLEIPKLVGPKRSTHFILQAKAYLKNDIFLKNEVTLQSKKRELFLDFETIKTDPYFDFIIIAGIYEIKNKKVIKKSFFSKIPKENQMIENINRFIEYVDNIKEDYVIYHWGSYEQNVLKNHIQTCLEVEYMEKAENMLLNMADLCKIYQDNVAIPSPSYSLKYLSKGLRYEWRNEMDGSQVGELYAKWCENNKKNQHIITKLIDYNMEDCEVTAMLLHKLKDKIELKDYN